MYRSATRTNFVVFQRLNAQFPSAFWLRLHSTNQSFSNPFKALDTCDVEDPHWHTGHGNVYSVNVHLPHINHIQGLPWQRRHDALFIHSSAQIHGKNHISMHMHVGSIRLLSDKSDEKENVEKKPTSALGLASDKDGQEKGCNVAKPVKQQSERNATSESGQTGIMHGQDSNLKSSERQQLCPDKHVVSSKRKKNEMPHSLKKHKRRQSEGTKLKAETDSAKVGAYDRLQLLKEKLIRKLGRRWQSCDVITETFEDFPYYLSENTRDLLVECAGARLKQHKYSKFGESLPSSSHLILLHGQPGTEIYQEVMVRALARHLQASLLVLDSNFLAARDLKDDAHISGLLLDDDDDNKEVACENRQVDNSGNAEDESIKTMTNLLGDPIKATNAKDYRSHEGNFSKPRKAPQKLFAEDNKKCFQKQVDVESKYWTDEIKKLVLTDREDELKKLGKHGEELKKLWHDLIIGDRVKFKGAEDLLGKSRSKVRIGQEGFVTSISEGLPWKVRVKFQGRYGAGEADEVFCNAVDLEKVESNASDEAWLARFPELPIEALCKMVLYQNPVIVHFPDIQKWVARAAPVKGRGLFVSKLGDLLNKVNGPVVFIAGRTKEDTAPSTFNIFDESIFGPLLFDMSKPRSKEVEEENFKGIDRVFKIFKNFIRIVPPENGQLLHTWQKQLQADKKIAMKRKNQMLLEKSLAHYGMGCVELSDVDTLDLQLTRKSAEKVIGWARNICLSNNQIQVNEGMFWLEKKCLEGALIRLRALKDSTEDKMSHVMELAENDYEKSLLSSVILAQDIGVKFDEIGALDDVKNTLKDLIILPLQRPELFKKGNLRKPCKGVLLFGPPGTGKTLLAKAVATEAGANFLSVSTSSITSKYYGDDEKLVKALFALARKLTPVVIFIDEVDSLLGARGGSSEHEATRRIKNEFMATWDGLQSKESEQILVLATTNRPFDLDDAVIRRLPRRLLVDLPNAENRVKVLRIILANEDLVDEFDYDALAAETEGYSGSDLKNLCVAAAYKPIREFLAAEREGKMGCPSSSGTQDHRSQNAVRPLCLKDFIQAKSVIGTSVAYDAASMIQLRRWNEQYGEGGSRSQIVFGFSQ